MPKYTVSVDFDGVIHSYESKWTNARTIPDPPVPNAIAFLHQISKDFTVSIFSTRNHQWGGRRAIKRWLVREFTEFFIRGDISGVKPRETFNRNAAEILARSYVDRFKFPIFKPPALIYIDDRAYRFTGDNWPTSQEIHSLRPWNKGRK